MHKTVEKFIKEELSMGIAQLPYSPIKDAMIIQFDDERENDVLIFPHAKNQDWIIMLIRNQSCAYLYKRKKYFWSVYDYQEKDEKLILKMEFFRYVLVDDQVKDCVKKVVIADGEEPYLSTKALYNMAENLLQKI
ncbi:hypothetical protein [Listeria costaricensis]|uniref:hypothetical protein n=1 Tax=Listeria costaricensis TaxID=2026604 RepID=UPI000C08A201|nr:hypothetical protein [Listeria costaricensis]